VTVRPLLRALLTRWQPDGNHVGFSSFCAADRRPPEAKDHSHEDATNLVTGMAAAALALTACGTAAGSSGGTLTGHAAVSAGHAPDSTWVTQQEDIAQAKRHIVWMEGDPGQAQRPYADPSRVTDQGGLAQVKRDIVRHAGQQARGR
jgi:hypothetical protein